MSSEAATEENTEATIHYLKKLLRRTAQGVFVHLGNMNEATELIIIITSRTATRKLQKTIQLFQSSKIFRKGGQMGKEFIMESDNIGIWFPSGLGTKCLG